MRVAPQVEDFSTVIARTYATAQARGLAGNPVAGAREFVDEVQARLIVASLRQGVNLARAAVNYLSPTTLSEAFLSTPLGILVRWASPDYAQQLLSDHKRSALAAIANTIPLIDKLAGEWFQGASTGIPAPDGTFTWTEWRRKAGLIADALRGYVAYQRDASLAFNAPRLIADLTISIVNCVTNPEHCMSGPGIPEIPIPWWVKGLGVGAALVGGVYVYNSIRR